MKLRSISLLGPPLCAQPHTSAPSRPSSPVSTAVGQNQNCSHTHSQADTSLCSHQATRAPQPPSAKFRTPAGDQQSEDQMSEPLAAAKARDEEQPEGRRVGNTGTPAEAERCPLVVRRSAPPSTTLETTARWAPRAACHSEAPRPLWRWSGGRG